MNASITKEEYNAIIKQTERSNHTMIFTLITNQMIISGIPEITAEDITDELLYLRMNSKFLQKIKNELLKQNKNNHHLFYLLNDDYDIMNNIHDVEISILLEGDHVFGQRYLQTILNSIIDLITKISNKLSPFTNKIKNEDLILEINTMLLSEGKCELVSETTDRLIDNLQVKLAAEAKFHYWQKNNT